MVHEIPVTPLASASVVFSDHSVLVVMLVGANTPASSWPLKRSATLVTFDQSDHPISTVGMGFLLVVVTPTICNIGVGRVLIVRGAGLNLLSPEVFRQMHVSGRELTSLALFCHVTDGKTIPLGQIKLSVTFVGWDNFHTESVTFDMAQFDLSYNTILGPPVLAKFMAAVHYAYNTIKNPRPSGVITIKADIYGLVHCA